MRGGGGGRVSCRCLAGGEGGGILERDNSTLHASLSGTLGKNVNDAGRYSAGLLTQRSDPDSILGRSAARGARREGRGRVDFLSTVNLYMVLYVHRNHQAYLGRDFLSTVNLYMVLYVHRNHQAYLGRDCQFPVLTLPLYPFHPCVTAGAGNSR